ncbi:hypothetical protein [Brachybacterium sp. UNK5269]|uniref:hypothetical protein n=1 Tax=Brachybacterium sp. UNK5269 TaxID=3408576 RepID=UPI003BAEB686
MSEDRERRNASPARCDVQGCAQPSKEWFTVQQPTFNVCHTHGERLRSGESHTAHGSELSVGLDDPGELLGVRWSKTAEATVMVLKLGHDGVVDQEVPVRVTSQLADLLRVRDGSRSIDSDASR